MIDEQDDEGQDDDDDETTEDDDDPRVRQLIQTTQRTLVRVVCDSSYNTCTGQVHDNTASNIIQVHADRANLLDK